MIEPESHQKQEDLPVWQYLTVSSACENRHGDADEARMARAEVALVGLSVGDAFGEQFFIPEEWANAWIADHILPPPPWPYTDDTEMGVSVVEVLGQYGRVDQDALAGAFVRRYDPSRGYGPAMHRILRRIARGENWRTVSRAAFDGYGSFGNGAAMRAGPIGAYFADDLAEVVRQASQAAETTHAHPEGIAGGVAVALAAALAARSRSDHAAKLGPDRSIEQILTHLEPGEVRSRMRRALDLSERLAVGSAAAILGNGSELSAQDTVPFALWCAARHLDDFEAAIWTAVSVFGDSDTICAIVGSVVACFVGIDGIPSAWVTAREPLPPISGARLP